MKVDLQYKFFYLILSLSIFLELFYGIDSAGSGGFATDFRTTWPLVEKPFEFSTDLDIKFPLHYYIAAVIYQILNDKLLLRITYSVISLIVPFLFFLCLKIKFKKININNLYLFSLVIFFLPSFRSSAVWPNTQITGIIFFLITLYFFLKWEHKKEFNKINKELFLTIFFMSLTVYTRQIYAMIFLYFILIYFIKLKKKVFLQSAILVGLLAIPGIYFVIIWPRILQATFDIKLYNSLLVNSSIISFYLIPFFLILYLFEKKKLFFKLNVIILSLIIIFVYFCSFYFDYNYLMGGGYFIKLSKLFFNNFSLFFLTSIVGFYMLYQLSNHNYLNILMFFILLFGVSAYIIFMKYFEPMFILILFLLLNTKLTEIFLKNKKCIYFYILYFFIYFSSAVLNNFFLFSKNI